jgi:hypothetical protein
MDRKTLTRLLLAVAGAAAAVVVLFFVLVALNGGSGFAGSTGATPLGWAIPLLSGLVIGGVAWMLLFQAPNYTGSADASRRPVPCPSCEKPVMADWRLCPYCGRTLPRIDVPSDR